MRDYKRRYTSIPTTATNTPTNDTYGDMACIATTESEDYPNIPICELTAKTNPYKVPLLQGLINGTPQTIFIDTGSHLHIINEVTARDINLDMEPTDMAASDSEAYRRSRMGHILQMWERIKNYVDSSIRDWRI